MKTCIQNICVSNLLNISTTMSNIVGCPITNMLVESSTQSFRTVDQSGEIRVNLNVAQDIDFILLSDVKGIRYFDVDTLDVNGEIIESNIGQNVKGFDVQYSLIQIDEVNVRETLYSTVFGTSVFGPSIFADGDSITPYSKTFIIRPNGDGTGFMQIGYIWAGKYSDFDFIEKVQPFDVSDDTISLTRANTTQQRKSYKYQQYTLTTRKGVSFKDIRALMRLILHDGYGRPRPWILTDGLFSENDPEAFIGILDSGKVGYDAIYISPVDDEDGPITAQVTIGLREAV